MTPIEYAAIILLGWTALSIATGMIAGRFIAAGKGTR